MPHIGFERRVYPRLISSALALEKRDDVGVELDVNSKT